MRSAEHEEHEMLVTSDERLAVPVLHDIKFIEPPFAHLAADDLAVFVNELGSEGHRVGFRVRVP